MSKEEINNIIRQIDVLDIEDRIKLLRFLNQKYLNTNKINNLNKYKQVKG